MKNNKLLNIIKQGNFTIPLYLFKIKEKLNIDDSQFLILMYLLNKGEKFIFNPKEISEDLNIDMGLIMQTIANLTEKKLLEVNTIKNEKNIMEDYIILDCFYKKVNSILLDDINNTPEDKSVYEIFESELGKTLSPIEYEIIKAWIESNIPEELILGALKETVYNGVSNLRYIDKILYEWQKKGFKGMSDVMEHQKKRRQEKEEPKEIFEFDWLDDEE